MGKARALLYATSLIWLLSAPAFGVTLSPALPLKAGAACEGGSLGWCAAVDNAQAVTIRTTFVPAAQLDDAQGEAAVVYLAGVGGVRAATPNILSLVWTIDHTAWWPAWHLELRTGGNAQPGAAAEGAPTVRALVNATPEAGHEYETLFSYAPASGAYAVRVSDLETGKQVYAGGGTVPAFVGQMQAMAGVAVGAAQMTSMATVPEYLPVGINMKVGQQGASGLVELRQIAQSEPLMVELGAPGGPGDGESWLQVLPEAGPPTRWGPLSYHADDASLTIPESALALGRNRIVMEYRRHDATLFTSTSEVTVGSATIGFTPQRELQLRVNQATPQLDIGVSVAFTKVTWDAEIRRYRYQEHTKTTLPAIRLNNLQVNQVYTVPLELTLPTEPGFWQLRFSAQTAQGIGLQVSGAEQWVSTYLPARLEPGQPFTIAVLPDTQFYAKTYPEIFMRQAEWLAANARERNIGLVLQLGDITDHNEPFEWENASKAMKALDGVVPYVMGVGNHDLVREAWILDRNATRVNQYFPPERFPALGGVFEPGHIENSYYLVDLSGQPYLIFSLEYGPRDAVLAWANQVADSYPDRRAIVVTHNYLTNRGTYAATGNTTSLPQATELAQKPGDVNDAAGVWTKFAMQHSNIFMILSGHMAGLAVPRLWDWGKAGNKVFALESDFSDHPHGGDGWMVLYEFHPELQRINVTVYSPYLDKFNTDVDERGYNNRFAIDLQTGLYLYNID